MFPTLTTHAESYNHRRICNVISLISEMDPALVEDESLSPYMFDASVVAECLHQQGTNVDRLSDPYHFKKSKKYL